MALGNWNKGPAEVPAEQAGAQPAQRLATELHPQLKERLQEAVSSFTQAADRFGRFVQSWVELTASIGQQPAPGRGGTSAPPGNFVEHLQKQLAELGSKLDALERRLAGLGEGGPSLQKSVAAVVGNEPKYQLEQHSKRVEDLRQEVQSLGKQIEELKTIRALEALPEHFASIEKAVKELTEKNSSDRDRLSAAYRDLISKNEEALTKAEDAMAQYQKLAEPMRRLDRYLADQEQQAAARKPLFNAELSRALLGRELAEDPELEPARQQLFADLARGSDTARALLGVMLLFWSSPPERKPPLLQQVGEAYYGWRPKTQRGSDKFEQALARLLQRSCQDAGINNSIELVEPGERFDSNRHTSQQRGVEITVVRGWVVLRSDNKVYGKALVTVR